MTQMTRSFVFKFNLLLSGLLLLAQTFVHATLLSSFTAGNGGWHMGTLAVGNIDNDSQLEIVVPYRDLDGNWFLDAYKMNGTRLAGFPYASGTQEMNTSPTLYDLDGDGKSEIIFTRGNSVIALRGTGSVMWSNQVNYANYVPDAGYQAYTNGFFWTGTGAFRSRLPSTAAFSSQFSSPIVADLNGNGTKEIVTAWKIDPDTTSNEQDYNPLINDLFGFGEWGTVGESWSGGVVFFNAQTGVKDFTYHIHQLVEAGVAVGHADTNQSLKTYVLNDSDSIVAFDKTKPAGFQGMGMLHGMFGKNLRMTSGFYQQAIDVYPADVDGDGLDEVLSVTTQINPLWQPHETLLDDDGALMWRHWKSTVTVTNNNGWFNNACMFAVNPDHDNHVDVLGFTHSSELTFRYWDGINFVDHPGWPKDFSPYLPTPPVVGDVDGDGLEEIVLGTYNPALNPSNGGLYIFALDGTLKQSITVPGGLKHIPFLADVNGDGSLDLIYRSLAGQVYVQNFGAITATNVSWATHRGNAERNGNLGRSLFPVNTPLVTKKLSGANKTHFEWSRGTNAVVPSAYRIYRADTAQGPFTLLTTVGGTTTSYGDYGLRPGWQYFYEIAAVVNGNEIRSAPFAIASLLNNNLIANGAFEENDNSHWDKWDNGNISWTNMIGSTNALGGKQSMQIRLQNDTTTDSINQYDVYGTPRSYMTTTPGTLYSFGGFIKSGGLTQPTKHWFEWTSTINGASTNTRPAFPYPNYFTPELSLGTAATGWTYLNRVFTMPAGFPNAELRHRFSTASPVSGNIYIDNVFFRALPPMNSGQWTDLFPFGSTWKFLAASPAANWFATNFNDSAWGLGTAKFGAGSGPTNILTQVASGKPAYYFRKTFSLTQTNFEELLLAATCTDDYGGTIYPMRVWINGTEILSSGIEAVSFDGNAPKYFDLTLFQNLLVKGGNTIAVQLNNTWDASWDNVAFDLALKAVPSGATARMQSLLRNGGNVALQISAVLGSSLRIESCDSLGSSWQLMETVPNVGTNSFSVNDTGQNGRPAPSAAPVRFYRVQAL